MFLCGNSLNFIILCVRNDETPVSNPPSILNEQQPDIPLDSVGVSNTGSSSLTDCIGLIRHALLAFSYFRIMLNRRVEGLLKRRKRILYEQSI